MPLDTHAELDQVVVVLPLNTHAEPSPVGTGLGLADAEPHPVGVWDLHYTLVYLCLLIRSVLDILGKVVDYEKNLIADLWKKEYYHDDEVVERGFLRGYCLEEEGQDLLDSVGVYWV